ncbi:histidine phosphatase family protein [Acidisoma sp. C75]
MPLTRFWLIRHALVVEEARRTLYGDQDVALCARTMQEQAEAYQALAGRLPRPARWFVTPLSRTRLTAEAIFAAGYPAERAGVLPGMIEQSFGGLQGLANTALAERLALPKHDFWPTAADERPEGGESFVDVLGRVADEMERLATAHGGEDLVIVCHGGVIRAAIAHAMGGIGGDAALRISIGNISLTRLEKRDHAWRLVSANETMAGVPAY